MRTALLLVAMTACAEGLPIEQLDAAHAEASCEWLVRCGVYDTPARCRAQFGGFDGYTTQLALARSRPVPLRVTPSLAAAVEARLVTYDPVQAEECVRLIADTSCNPGDQTRRVPLVMCVGVFRSGRPVGAACAMDAECGSRTCEFDDACDRGTCCAGVCAPVEGVGGIGASCIDYRCGPTSFCYQQTCVPLLVQGTPCDSNEQCDFGLVCLDTCQPPLAAGDACALTRLGWDCGGDVPCDRTTLRCTPWLTVGEACEPDSDRDRCAPSYAWCDPATLTCALLPTRGQPCPTGRCGDDSWCAALPPDGSICAAPVPDGAQCRESSVCASGACNREDVCVPEPVCL